MHFLGSGRVIPKEWKEFAGCGMSEGEGALVLLKRRQEERALFKEGVQDWGPTSNQHSMNLDDSDLA